MASALSGVGAVRARVLQASLRFRAAGGKGAGGKAGGKSSPAKSKKVKTETPVGPTVDKEIRAKTVLGANIAKDGADPPIKADDQYPDWLFHLLGRPVPLSELERRNPQAMATKELQRFVKLDNRRRVKENNALKAKS